MMHAAVTGAGDWSISSRIKAEGRRTDCLFLDGAPKQEKSRLRIISQPLDPEPQNPRFPEQIGEKTERRTAYEEMMYALSQDELVFEVWKRHTTANPKP